MLNFGGGGKCSCTYEDFAVCRSSGPSQLHPAESAVCTVQVLEMGFAGARRGVEIQHGTQDPLTW